VIYSLGLSQINNT